MPDEMMTFKQELASLINRHSRENPSNTPDFVLAQFIEASLAAFESASLERERWYGQRLYPGWRHDSSSATLVIGAKRIETGRRIEECDECLNVESGKCPDCLGTGYVEVVIRYATEAPDA